MDDGLREARRRWEGAPEDLASADAYVAALRRAGLPVPLAVLENRRFPARRLSVDLPVDVGAEQSDGWDVDIGMPSPHVGNELDVPSCREWWFLPQGVSSKQLVELAREHGPPHLELIVPPKRLRFDGLGVRSLTVGARLLPGGWAQLDRLRSLERLEVGEAPRTPGAQCPPNLVALGLHRVDADALEFLANAPPLTSLALNWIQRGLELTPLWSVPSLRHLEALALGSGDAEAQLDAIGAWPDLRRLRLLGRYLLPNEFAARLGGMQRLEHLAIRNGPSLSVPELATILRRPLRSLELGGAAALTDDAFDALSRCSSLDRLTLDLVHDPQLTGRMTDQGLEHLTLPALRTLHLRCPGVRGEGLRPEALPELRRLRLAVAGRRAAEQVGQLPHLRHLDMSAGALTADMVEPLAASTTLCSLRASVGPTTAEALGELLARSSITELELTATTFTPDLVRALSRGARLRRLALLRPGIPGGDTPIDVSHLEALLELQDLAIMGQAVVPGSWSSLARLASLRVVRHECSDGSVLPTIRAALPGVHVVGRVPQPRSRDLRA